MSFFLKIFEFYYNYLSFLEDNTMDKDYMRSVSDLDQAGAHLSQFATMLFTYHHALTESGFQRSEALELVRELQNVLFAQAFNLGPNTNQSDEDF